MILQIFTFSLSLMADVLPNTVDVMPQLKMTNDEEKITFRVVDEDPIDKKELNSTIFRAMWSNRAAEIEFLSVSFGIFDEKEFIYLCFLLARAQPTKNINIIMVDPSCLSFSTWHLNDAELKVMQEKIQKRIEILRTIKNVSVYQTQLPLCCSSFRVDNVLFVVQHLVNQDSLAPNCWSSISQETQPKSFELFREQFKMFANTLIKQN